MARRPYRQEAGKQSAKTTRVFNGPKATAGEMPTRYHRPITTRSQSPLSRTPPRNPLGTPTKPPPPAHQTSPARSRHFPNCPTRTLNPATKSQRKEKTKQKGKLTRADNKDSPKARLAWASASKEARNKLNSCRMAASSAAADLLFWKLAAARASCPFGGASSRA